MFLLLLAVLHVRLHKALVDLKVYFLFEDQNVFLKA